MTTATKYLLILVPVFFSVFNFANEIPSTSRSETAINNTLPYLETQLKNRGLKIGRPIFIRIFKKTAELEVWVQSNQQFELFKTYDICKFFGDPGPKTKQGDKQAPEGFYFVTPQQLNPWSQYHLSFDLGYPNQYDRSRGYTGSALMVHGKCVSIGCFAMTDKNINEIYTLSQKAFENGQPFFRVHIFPFRLDEGELEPYKNHKWFAFWKNLQEGYLRFKNTKMPPNVLVRDRRYYFETDE